MNQLKEVTFINSATIPFKQIELDGNTLFSGGNGAGKTTILRSILYFYGAQRSENLGISRKKKRFEEYYFATINSYLVYRFQNEGADVLAIIYKAGGMRVKYRFALERNKEEMKSLFFEQNSALEPKELWARLLEKEYELSPVLNSPREYKSVLYGQDRKLQHFSFFNANAEYEQISKTLSNIFINSKLDSGSIKKSLVSTISGFDAIDLNQMRRNINDFRTKHDDISSFEKNSVHIHEAVSALGVYEEQGSLLHKNALALGANAKLAEEELESVKATSLAIQAELLALTGTYESELSSYLDKHEKNLKEQGGLEREIKEAEAKEKEYEKARIKEKLALWEKKPRLGEELAALQQQLGKLLDDKGSLSERFDAMREEEMRSLREKEQRLRVELSEIESAYNKENALLMHEEQTRYSEHNNKREVALQRLSQELSEAKERLSEAQTNEQIIQNRSFEKEKIESAKSEFHEAQRAYSEVKSALLLEQSKAEKLSEKIYSAEQSKVFDLQALLHQHEKETRSLKGEIALLLKHKNLNAASLLGYMRESGFKEASTLCALLKEEILHAEGLNPSLSLGDGTLLGLRIDCSALDISAYEENAVTISLHACEERLRKMDSQYLFQQEEIENRCRNEMNALRREQGSIKTLIDEHLRLLPQCEQKSLLLSERFEQVSKAADEQKKAAIVLARAQKEEQQKGYSEHKRVFDEASQALHTELHALKTELKERRARLELSKEEALRGKNEAGAEIKAECDKKLEQIREQEQQTLIKGGVDAELLKRYHEEIDLKQAEISKIEAFSELIAEYRIDQKRIFSTLGQKRRDLVTLSTQIKEEEQNFLSLKAAYTSAKTQIEQKKDEHTSEVTLLQKDLKAYASFKESALYAQLSLLIENSSSQANEENLSDMIDRLRDLGFEHASSKEKLRKKLNRAFLSISLHNIFNLYAPSTDEDREILDSAQKLKSFVLENKIETYKEQVAKEFTMTLRHLSSEIAQLLKAEGEISKTVNKINKTLQDLQGIKVIRSIELRYKESDNLLLNVLKAIGKLVDENPYGNEINLFTQEIDWQFNHKALRHLDELARYLSEEKEDSLSLDESFVLEFRAVENGNDTGFVSSLDGIGSNGTDVMVKAMVNIAMLSLARKQSAKHEASVYFHCILDEVGILSPAYLKELIAYANNKKIRFVNGAPDEKLVSTYKRLYMLSTNERHQTIVRRLVSQQ
ncbi:MAG: ATP-binding protein [Campylobacterales bacterium]|nr:ATP-binding protein [Campylobacterales bacterium]